METKPDVFVLNDRYPQSLFSRVSVLHPWDLKFPSRIWRWMFLVVSEFLAICLAMVAFNHRELGEVLVLFASVVGGAALYLTGRNLWRIWNGVFQSKTLEERHRWLPNAVIPGRSPVQLRLERRFLLEFLSYIAPYWNSRVKARCYKLKDGGFGEPTKGQIWLADGRFIDWSFWADIKGGLQEFEVRCGGQIWRESWVLEEDTWVLQGQRKRAKEPASSFAQRVVRGLCGASWEIGAQELVRMSHVGVVRISDTFAVSLCPLKIAAEKFRHPGRAWTSILSMLAIVGGVNLLLFLGVACGSYKALGVFFLAAPIWVVVAYDCVRDPSANNADRFPMRIYEASPETLKFDGRNLNMHCGTIDMERKFHVNLYRNSSVPEHQMLVVQIVQGDALIGFQVPFMHRTLWSTWKNSIPRHHFWLPKISWSVWASFKVQGRASRDQVAFSRANYEARRKC